MTVTANGTPTPTAPPPPTPTATVTLTQTSEPAPAPAAESSAGFAITIALLGALALAAGVAAVVAFLAYRNRRTAWERLERNTVADTVSTLDESTMLRSKAETRTVSASTAAQTWLVTREHWTTLAGSWADLASTVGKETHTPNLMVVATSVQNYRNAMDAWASTVNKPGSAPAVAAEVNVDTASASLRAELASRYPSFPCAAS